MFSLVFISLLCTACLAVPETQLPKTNSRIVGGAEVTPGQFPYQTTTRHVSWGYNWHSCGSTIISERWVLTAAHCVQSYVASDLAVRAGDHNMNIAEGREQEISVEKIIMHPNYGQEVYIENDIALLKLSKPFHFNKYVQKISLPPEGHTATGVCTVSGWGALYMDGPAPSTLHSVNVPIVTDQRCKGMYGIYFFPQYMICAGYEEGGYGMCSGDSGGPLTCYDLDKPYQAGIVSASWCGAKGFAGIYTETSRYISWIRSVMNSN